MIVAWDVLSREADGEVTVRRTRDLAIATGLRPRLPAGVSGGPRVWHNREILDRVESVPAAPEPRRFVVVGAGQSAAEVVDFLHRRFPTAEVCSVFTKWGYTPADDSPYANRIFDADAVDVFFDADEPVKRMLFDAHRSTNYSVVDAELIEELYRREYQERVQGRQRLRMMNASAVVDLDARDDGVTVEVAHLPSGRRDRLRRRRRRLRHRVHVVRSGGGARRRGRPGRPPARRRTRGRPRLPAGARRPRRRRGVRPGRYRALARAHARRCCRTSRSAPARSSTRS